MIFISHQDMIEKKKHFNISVENVKVSIEKNTTKKINKNILTRRRYTLNQLLNGLMNIKKH